MKVIWARKCSTPKGMHLLVYAYTSKVLFVSVRACVVRNGCNVRFFVVYKLIDERGTCSASVTPVAPLHSLTTAVIYF